MIKSLSTLLEEMKIGQSLSCKTKAKVRSHHLKYTFIYKCYPILLRKLSEMWCVTHTPKLWLQGSTEHLTKAVLSNVQPTLNPEA